ncbi:MAG: RNB domain-containing ribonuclease, partial [Cyanobacteria bacterium P01_F01_bin.42]
MLEKGAIVEFRLQGDSGSDNKHRIGLFERPEGKKHLVVVDQAGRSHTVHPRQISYTVAGTVCEAIADLKMFSDQVGAVLDPSSLEVAWELLLDEQEPTTPEDMALLLFSKQSPHLCYAAYCLLTDDKIYFKQKGDRFEPRSEKQVSELKHQIQRQAERQQQEEAFYQNLEQAIAGELVSWTSSDRLHISPVEQLALFGDEAKNRTQATELLGRLSFDKTPQGAFQLMVALGLWDKHENLALRRNNISTEFSTDVLTATEQCLTMPPPDADQDHRRDLTHLKVYTIDDEST